MYPSVSFNVRASVSASSYWRVKSKLHFQEKDRLDVVRPASLANGLRHPAYKGQIVRIRLMCFSEIGIKALPALNKCSSSGGSYSQSGPSRNRFLLRSTIGGMKQAVVLALAI